MRILELRFKNLNSLYGEWSVDFTVPEFIRDGIFLINGPTGAGKSTLLDALCLALYGKTPRLKTISQSENEILSRLTGECFAEVTFETASGRYRAHWSQRRAYGKPDGNLLDSKHEVSDAVSGELLASKKRETASRIERETGMDFDRFTRSIMLAQGGFAVFLQAAPDERAPILEQITGTEIYSNISKKVHERLAEEKKRLELLEERAGSIRVLDEAAEKDIQTELAEKQAKEKVCVACQAELARFIGWLLKIEALEKETAELEQSLEAAQKAHAAFEPDRIRLEHALLAAELESEYVTLAALRLQQKTDLKSLETNRETLPGLEKALELKGSHLKEAQETLEKIKAAWKAEQAVIRKVREKDQDIRQKKESLKSLSDACAKMETRINREKAKYKTVKQSLSEAQKGMESVSGYLSDHAGDSDIPVLLVSIREKQNRLESVKKSHDTVLRQLEELKKEREKKQQEEKTLEKSFLEYEKALHDCKADATGIEKEMAALLDGRSLKGYRAELAGLMREMAYRQTIARLEDERAKLVKGEACPLCGSTEHPFAEGTVPRPDKVQEKIDRLDALVETLEGMEDRLAEARKKESKESSQVENAQKEKTRIQYELERTSADVQRLEKDLEISQKETETLVRALDTELKPFRIELETGNGIEQVIESLEKRAGEFKAKQAEKSRLEKSVSKMSARVKELEGIQVTLETGFNEQQTALEKHEVDLKNFEAGRRDLYGEKDPDEVEARMEQQTADASVAEAAAVKARLETKQELAALSAKIADLKKTVSGRRDRLEEMEQAFAGRLNASRFEDEKAFMEKRLTTKERKSLAQAGRKLDHSLQAAAARIDDRREKLQAAKEEKLTEQPRETLEAEQSDLSAVLRDLGQNIGALKQRLADNLEARARLKTHAEEIDVQKKTCAKWGALHALIGSADGKKYRNFAQGITFELMIAHANRQLEKMSDRYLLVRDETRPLELNIVDDYQAGEIRSTKNLSGGESFIVSLSLALGLSGMASRNVRVDSLFLDEGFGTLDDEALETALHALGSLQQTGKLVGLISHVPALQESINTRIKVSPVSGGRSIISGPGCMGS